MTQHIYDSEFPWCPTDAKAGEFYKLRLKDLSPTQFAVGKAEIQVRAGRMRKKVQERPWQAARLSSRAADPDFRQGRQVLPG